MDVAFWYKAHPAITRGVSDPTMGSIPVGVDFYTISDTNEGTGNQFGPFGALVPLQLYNQTGRGIFRCAGSDLSPQNISASNRKLLIPKGLGRKW